MTQDMRGLFFIVQGQYRHNVGPQWRNPVSESVNWCGGFDPTDPNTDRWFMLMDWATLTCHRASSDLDYVLEGIKEAITKYKTKEVFVNTIKGLSFGSASKTQRALDEHLGELYGEHFAAQVRAAEDRAYTELKDTNPVLRARKLKKRHLELPESEDTTPTQVQAPENTGTPTGTFKKRLVPKKRQVGV